MVTAGDKLHPLAERHRNGSVEMEVEWRRRAFVVRLKSVDESPLINPTSYRCNLDS